MPGVADSLVYREWHHTCRILRVGIDDHQGQVLEHRWDVRGGIAWPTVVDGPDRKDFRGFALLAARDVDSGPIHVIEQAAWITVEPFRHGDSVEPGLGEWLRRMWVKWYGRKYYWRQPEDQSRRYRLEILRPENSVEPRPEMIEAHWSGDDGGLDLIHEVVTLKRLRAPKISPLGEALVKINSGEHLSPPVHALACVLAGYAAAPWREKHHARED